MSYAKHIAEAVRSAMYEAIRESGEWSVASDLPDIDLDAIIASVPKPDPVGYINTAYVPQLYREHAGMMGPGDAIYAEPVHNAKINGAQP